VVAVGGWPDDLTTSHTTRLAFRAVAETIASRCRTGGLRPVNPQLQQPDEFNYLLRRVWS
jgi:hypothetical protein